MRFLVVGAGAREHALAARLRAEPGAEVLCAPGNAGTTAVARNVAVAATDVPRLVELAVAERVDLVVVGPEAPLVLGLADALAARGVRVFGPTARAARLEGSKAFAKEFMARHGIPTAPFRVFDDAREADAFVEAHGPPLVVKADGLAAGKGVVVAGTVSEAKDAIDSFMRRRSLGDAGQRVVVEDCLVGEEVSYHVVSDGTRYIALAPAQDHKRIHDGDRGPNTGGMGAYSPPPVVDAAIERVILEAIVEPTLRGMDAEGAPVRGALFVGLMMTASGPTVLEYNVRFGDPECEVLLARLDGPLSPLLVGAAQGDLGELVPRWGAPAALAVVLAAPGYPGEIRKGMPIAGLEAARALEGVALYHAGTALEGGETVVAGGRVVTVAAAGATLDDAAARAYAAAELVTFEGRQLRRDIGWRARRRAGSGAG